MLENYSNELAQKRRERRIFWIVVWLFAIFLYLFFQGYYPYVRVDLTHLMNGRPSDMTGSGSPQIVRAFGIINIRTVPSPDTITVDGKNFINGDKVIYDYGSYPIKIEKSGYIGLETNALLDKKNPFLIENLELLKRPVSENFAFEINSLYELPSGKILVSSTGAIALTQSWTHANTGGIASGAISIASTNSGTISDHAPLTKSGTMYRIFSLDTPTEAKTFYTTLSPIGKNYFKNGTGGIFTLDESTLKFNSLKNSAGTGSVICGDVKLIGNDLYCPSLNTFITGNASDAKSTILSVKDKIIATSEGFFSSSQDRIKKIAASQSGSSMITKIDDIVEMGGNEYLLISGELYPSFDIQNALPKENQFDASPLVSIGKIEKFGKDTVLFGYMNNASGFVFIDERGNHYPVSLDKAQISGIKMQPLGSGFLIWTDDNIYFYQKGAEKLELLSQGKTLLVRDDSILYKKDGKTYLMPLIIGE